VTAKQTCVTLPEGAGICHFFLTLEITKTPKEWKQKNSFFGKNTKEVSRSEAKNMWKRTSILQFMVGGKFVTKIRKFGRK